MHKYILTKQDRVKRMTLMTILQIYKLASDRITLAIFLFGSINI